MDATASWAPPPPVEHRSSKRWLLWVLLGAVVLFGGCAALAVANARVRNTAIAYAKGADHIYYLRSQSMAPAIPRNARVAATSHIGTVRRGDVVVIRSPQGFDPSVKVIVKRVVGLPGDEIGAPDDHVHINGNPLAEPYLAPGTQTAGLSTRRLGADEYFVLGDSRMQSNDSRTFGPIPRSEMVGVVIRVLSPPSVAGPVPGSSR